MTEEANTRVVQGLYAAFREGNYTAILDAFSDVFEWHMPGSAEVFPWAKTLRTKQDVSLFFDEFLSAAEVLAVHVNSFLAQGDKVVVLGSLSARAKVTGHEYTDHWAMVWTLKDGKVTGHRTYHDTARAGEALQGMARN
jgi:ketosteroid isomerase-like protein